MAYIGSKPADKVLTASDITDGVVSTAKIADNAVTADKTSYKDVPFRNILINGDMSQAQRGTSGTLQNGTGGYLCVDRWKEYEGGSESFVFTVSQDTDVPTGQGFIKSLKFDCTTADASLASDGALSFRQAVEGFNLQHLKKGTSSAESLTLSFWVKSVKTGTYTIALVDVDNTRSISKSYTVDSGSTWEQKEITFAGDTTGAFGNDNGNSLQVEFYLGAGSNYTSGTLATSWGSNVAANQRVGQVNLADSTSNDFWITGVQLEVGTSASDFEFLPVDVNLERCQRYYQKSYSYATALGTNTTVGIVTTGGSAGGFTTGYLTGNIKFEKIMRAAPTLTFYEKGGDSGVCSRLKAGVSRTDNQPIATESISDNNASIYSTGTADAGSIDVHFEATAEL